VRAFKQPYRISLISMLALALVGILPAALDAQAKAPSKTPATSTAKKPATRTSLARAAAARRARAASAQRLQQEAMTARFKRDLGGNLIPDVRAAAAIIYDPQTGATLYDENARDIRSIASLTKIMTAVTFMADAPDLSQVVAVTRADMKNASVTYLKANDLVSFGTLMHLTLIASDNAAARVLARTAEGGSAAFVARMNEMAAHLDMASTQYFEPSGLDARNVSSALDLSHLIAFAASDEQLGAIMRTSEYEARTSRRTFKIHSTNKLLGTDVDVRGGKTGFISKAGYCLATLLQVNSTSQVAVVVLGAANSTMRFWEARHLFNWVVGRTQGLVGGQPDQPLSQIQ